MSKKLDQFNMVMVGTGGQGLITILQIIAEAALIEGYDVKTSELHGLAQRGGSVEVHIRFGKKIFSPLVSQGKADLILGLEIQEGLKACSFANPKTTFLINKFFIPISSQKAISENEILKILKEISGEVALVEAADICQKELGTKVVAGIYLISLAAVQKIIPLKTDSISGAIKKIIPAKYLELNLRTFKLAQG